MTWKNRARLFEAQRERRIAIRQMDKHISRTRGMTDTLAASLTDEFPAVATAADLSGVLVDALENAHEQMRSQYVADSLTNSQAECGEIVLVTRARDERDSMSNAYWHEFMLVRESLAPNNAILSVEPMVSSDLYLALPPGGISDYFGALSFNQPTQDALADLRGLGKLRWGEIVEVWRFLYAECPGFALRDGSAPHRRS